MVGPWGPHATGLALIACVAVIWVFASFAVQTVEATGVPAFLLTYIANILFVVYLPLYGVVRWRSKKASLTMRYHAYLVSRYNMAASR